MAIRDLGYKPYDGARLPASHNHLVFLSHGLSRAFGSWVVKLTVFLSLIPLIVYLIGIPVAYARVAALNMMMDTSEAFSPATYTRAVFDWQFWICITAVTVGAGAGVIARDLSLKAFQFYLAKPITRHQYLGGRIGAVAVFCFSLAILPTFLSLLISSAFVPAGERAITLLFLLPALAYSAIIAVVCSTVSVAVSAMSKSRSLTMSAWILLLALPHALGMLVHQLADFPWLKLASIPALLGAVGDALFRIPSPNFPVPEGNPIPWWLATLLLTGITAFAVMFSSRQLERAEVIT